MKVHELIEELIKIPNQNLEVVMCVEGNSYEVHTIDEVNPKRDIVELIVPLTD